MKKVPPSVKRWLLIMRNFAFAIAIFLASLAAGYEIYRAVFGKPAGIFSYLGACLIGILIFAILGKVIFDILKRTRHMAEHERSMRGFMETTVEALEKIAKGDFNVSLTANVHDPFSELTESVNRMARGLSNMEVQRQDFISNVSHEIQSPLTSISGFAALLKTDSLTGEQRRHYLDIIEAESKRLSKLSDNLLKLSALEAESAPLSRTVFRLDRQLQNAILTLEPQWDEKHIEIEAELPKTETSADEGLMLQVWINLLHNAVKFTPQNGRISVTLRESEDGAECIVADNGSGIPKDDQVHIFERFYKVDKSRDRSLGGNGLGLSLVKKIVELHGGTVTFESEPGAGTVFSVFLPK